MCGTRHVIWGGYINADFLRMTGHVIATREFIESIPLSMSWEKFKVDFTHCYEINGITLTNTLDHWFWSSELNKYIEKCGVHHCIENKSDHSPIFMKLNTEFLPSSISGNIERQPRASWKNASPCKQNAYTNIIIKDLSKIIVPDECNCVNVHCKEKITLQI